MSSSNNKKKSSKPTKPETVTIEDDDTIPEDVRNKVKEFSKSIDSLKLSLKPMIENLSNVESCADPINRARLDLTAVYTLNSLFWLYLLAQGKNPKDHEVKRELDRLKVSMSRLRDIESSDESNKRKQHQIDSSVAKRMIKHTLSMNHNQQAEDETMSTCSSTGSAKRIKKM